MGHVTFTVYMYPSHTPYLSMSNTTQHTDISTTMVIYILISNQPLFMHTKTGDESILIFDMCYHNE